MNGTYKSKKVAGNRAQAIVEFAIALPILMALLVGILEVGRMIFIYSAVTNASREASRYASAIGKDDSGLYAYKNCDGIQKKAKSSAFLITLSSITITYDTGPGTTSFATCNLFTSPWEDPDISVDTGDRVKVTVQADYKPMVRLVPIGNKTFTSSSARTFLGLVDLGSGSSSTWTPAASSTPATPSNTPTATTVPSDTPIPTNTSIPATAGPLPSNTPVPSNTPLPTNTFTSTPTFTPTITLTPTLTTTPTTVTTCGSVTAGAISTSDVTTTMSMTITNPNVYPLTVSTVEVIWNHDLGHKTGPDKTLKLQSASLGSVFWTGNATGPSLTITPSTTVTIPAATTSTITFTFHQIYDRTDGTESIKINLSTPGCQSSPIHMP